MVKPEKIRQAKRYYRGMEIIEPKTISNKSYQNKPLEEKPPLLAKGTKKFYDKTQNLYSSLNKPE